MRKLDANSHRSASSYNSTRDPHAKPLSGKMLARMLWMVCLMWMVWIMLWTCHWFKQLQLYLIMLFVVGLFVSVIKHLHVVRKRGDQSVCHWKDFCNQCCNTDFTMLSVWLE